jgi:hypothetical protein
MLHRKNSFRAFMARWVKGIFGPEGLRGRFRSARFRGLPIRGRGNTLAGPLLLQDLLQEVGFLAFV